MANPKRRTTKSRRDSEKSVETNITFITECPQCHEPRLPHRACPSCGYYKGREVIKVKAE